MRPDEIRARSCRDGYAAVVLSGSLRLFRIAGIDVRIHPSWLLIFVLLTWSLATGWFPYQIANLSTSEAWALGAVAALLLFGSVLVHELAHSLVARARGMEARSITLFIFGGVSQLGGESPRPSTEFVVAIVGPLTSFLLAGLAAIVAYALPGSPYVLAVASYLALVNALLGAFNLIPGYPLDGGRVLRAIAWNVTGSMRRGTEIAGIAGQLVAYGFLVWGFWQVLTGNVFNGIWIAVIGWFLQGAAGSSVQQVRLQERLRGARVADVMRPDVTSVPPGATVSQLIDGYLMPGNRRAVPVVLGDRLLGMVTVGDVRSVPTERRPYTFVSEVMGGREGVVTARPQDPLADAVEAMSRGDFEQIPVVDDGRLVGVLSRADVLRQIQLRETLNLESPGR